MDAAIWGLIGTLVGAFASIATTWIASRTSHQLSREAAREERLERFRAFQRQTLLELQEAIHDSLRMINRAYIEDAEVHRKGGTWRKSRLSDEVDEGVRLAQRKVAILTERVYGDALRAEVKSLMSSAVAVLFSPSQKEAELRINAVTGDAERVLERLGSVLRSHFSRD